MRGVRVCEIELCTMVGLSRRCARPTVDSHVKIEVSESEACDVMR
jgi:hypothetical protein